MFNKKTVFILGAGASWHYGYPTGELLIGRIIKKAKILSTYLQFSEGTTNDEVPDYIAEKTKTGISLGQAWKTAFAESKGLEAALTQTNPLVIDYFLGLNPALRPIGTLLIAWVILECETVRRKTGLNANRTGPPVNKDDWCRFIIHQLAIDCRTSADLLSNDVTFVTFNYDVSLEIALSQGLEHIELFKKDDVIQKFFEGDRFLHIYGAIRPAWTPSAVALPNERDPGEFSAEQRPVYLKGYKQFLDHALTASRGLRVIDPEEKETDKHVIEAACKAIAATKSVYILGYGFDENNSKRLCLPECLNYQKTDKSVFFTNFRNINRVNKRASKVFFGNDVHFARGDDVERAGAWVYERSTRDVYEALELDFESFE